MTIPLRIFGRKPAFRRGEPNRDRHHAGGSRPTERGQQHAGLQSLPPGLGVHPRRRALRLDRVYVYGSHDRFGAPLFCLNDYVCWSAPVDNLADWTCSGVIFRKNQDPMNRLGLRILFAPDVAQGPDGRYYLCYAFDFLGVIGV